MPFCQEVGEHTAVVRNMTSDGVARGIYVQSRWVIQSFRKKTNSTGLNSAFVVLRGNVHKTIESESQHCDLIVLGKTGTNPLRTRRLGSTAKALIKNHTKPLLLVEKESRLGYPMMVAYHQTPIGNISIETAKDLLNPEETLIILLCEDDPEEFSDNIAYLKQWAGEHKVNITIQSFKSQAIKRFIRMANGLKTGLLILPHDENEPGQTLTQQCLEGISLPILLIRTAD